MGRRPKPRGRDIHGIVVLNKPGGITSNQCLQRVKRLFNANRAGHTGSLDKPATGMLPICLGEATKLSQYILDADKEYLAVIQFGATTTTGDADGDIISKFAIPDLERSQILTVLNDFTGDISQIPPMFSAIKQNGQPLYKLAYQQQEVEREPRNVMIYKLELEDCTNDTISVRVACSKGTYIRSLAMDIGDALGTGAHIKHLHRVRVGCFTEEDMLSLTTLENHSNPEIYLRPSELAVTHLPAVILEQNSAEYIQQGQAVMIPNAPTQGLVRLYDESRQFFGIGRILDDGRVAPKRLLNFTEKNNR